MIQQPIKVYLDKKLVLARKIGSLIGGGMGFIFLFMTFGIFGPLSILVSIIFCLTSVIFYVRIPDVHQPLFIFTEKGLWDYSKKGKKRFLAWKDYSKTKVWRTRRGYCYMV